MAIIFIRTALFYILTVLSLRLMGKRQIGELEPTELVVTILISQLATMPMTVSYTHLCGEKHGIGMPIYRKLLQFRMKF